jgi:hypothetical protein
MSSSSVFANLIAAKPTWAELREFLRSEEGGKISVYEVPGTSLATLRYVKGESIMDLEHVGAFRSVVWNTETNRPVSVSTYKSEKGESLPPNDSGAVILEEFLDGVMIGQFWDPTTESWRIHTRTMLDATARRRRLPPCLPRLPWQPLVLCMPPSHTWMTSIGISASHGFSVTLRIVLSALSKSRDCL